MLSIVFLVSAAGLNLPAGHSAVRAQVKAVDGAVADSLARGERTPSIQADKESYGRGEVMVITGSGFDPGEAVTLTLHAKPAIFADKTVHVVADSFGNVFDNQFQAEGPGKGVLFLLSATGATSGLRAQAAMANPSANLDQWANKVPASWVNGNLGASKAIYHEGDSIPYRLVFGSLPLTTHVVTIQWDTTKGGKHALDYLTTYDYRVSGPQPTPCAGVTGCNPLSFTTHAIPVDPNVSGAGVTQAAGVFTLFGGTITNVSGYTLSGSYAGDSSTAITVTFDASVANPVLAWGGHISTRVDWGAGNSAVAVPGSPYHTRLLALDGAGGNQDRSLSADAVIFPGSITINKACTGGSGGTGFGFTASPSPISNFSLDCAGTKVFTPIETFQSYTVTESTLATGWAFTSLACSHTSPNGGSESVSGTTATLDMKEGENYTCIYTNAAPTPTPTLTPTPVPTDTPTPVPTSTPTPFANPSICTAQKLHPNDTATISNLNETGSGTGDIVFNLFGPDDPNCEGTPAYTTTVNDVTANGPYSTNNTTFDATAVGTWKWQVTYTGDSRNTGTSSICGAESFTITNDCAGGSAPTTQRARTVRRTATSRVKSGINWTRLMLIGIP
jgi:hypothetical protein